jgi:hypothetical protein
MSDKTYTELHRIFSKGKGYPRTDHKGPEEEQRYGSTLSSTSVLYGIRGQRHAPAALRSEKKRCTYCVGRWVDSRGGLDGCGKSPPHRDSITGPSSPQQVATPTALSRPKRSFAQ